MNKWIAELDPIKALELMGEFEGSGSEILYAIWITEVDRVISNDGLGENHSNLPDWDWFEAYSTMDLSPSEAVNSYLIDQTNSLLESFTAFSD